jgi:hypothetical protein
VALGALSGAHTLAGGGQRTVTLYVDAKAPVTPVRW